MSANELMIENDSLEAVVPPSRRYGVGVPDGCSRFGVWVRARHLPARKTQGCNMDHPCIRRSGTPINEIREYVFRDVARDHWRPRAGDPVR